MKTISRFTTALLLFPLFATALQAHPGHPSNTLHALLGSPFSGIDHLVAWSVFVAATTLVLIGIRRGGRHPAATPSRSKSAQENS
jgi:hypothetical protein